MPIRYDIQHTTIYRYRQPVRFGEHRVMFRPRDSHDLRVLATDLDVSPDASVRMIQDPHLELGRAGAAARAAPTSSRSCARSASSTRTANNLELPLSNERRVATRSPTRSRSATTSSTTCARTTTTPTASSPPGRASSSAPTGRPERATCWSRMNQHIRDNLRYLGARRGRHADARLETLSAGSGSCRDFALLMMEAARRLGVATRFVSGYLYDPALDGDTATRDVVGAGYTHAWLQAYLPGAGWVPFDPTNNLLGGTQLIRVGVARDPSQAAPISGSWFGETDDYIGMTVSVTVKRRR